MTTLNQLLIDAEIKLSAALGGATTLSNPSENSNDPLVQIMLTALAGQIAIDEKIESKLYSMDIRSIDCDCLDIIAAKSGDYRRTNKRTSASIVILGTLNTLIPANTQFKDKLGNSWYTEIDIIVKNNINFGKVVSTKFEALYIEPNELQLDTPISGITLATNGNIIELGYSEESCEQFRTRLLNKSISAYETEDKVIYELLKISRHAKFINDYPNCDGAPCLKSGFVVSDGDDTEIASIIRDYAPLNYVNLGGNISINFDCETVKFIRPCPVGIEIEYSGTKELNSSDFESVICSLNSSVYAHHFSKLNCIKSLKFRTVRQVPDNLNCDDIASTTSCGKSYSFISNNCPCALSECNSREFKNCANLKSWEFPVFISASYLGDNCE